MSTIELEGFVAPETKEANRFGAALGQLWQPWRNHREAQRNLHLLQDLDPRALRDIGFEPAEIYGTRHGTIGEIHGDAWKGLDR